MSTRQDGEIAAIKAVEAQQNARLDSLESKVSNVAHQIDLNNRQAEGGIAAAMALGGTLMPAYAKLAISFNLATYRGQQGFSATTTVKASDHVYLNAGFAGSTVGGSSGGRVDMTFAW